MVDVHFLLNMLCYVYFFSVMSSPEFCLILGRRVLIFPKGNNVDYLSMYLDVADSASLPYGWSRYAQFSLAVVNQIQNKYTVRKGRRFSLIIAFLTR